MFYESVTLSYYFGISSSDQGIILRKSLVAIAKIESKDEISNSETSY